MASAAKKQFFMRPMNGDDLATLALWFEQICDLTLFDSQSTLPVNEKILQKDWEREISGGQPRNCYWFGIDDQEGELVGLAGIDSISYINGDCVLPIILTRKVRHQGLGLQIAAMLIDMAFDELRLHRITTYFRSDNEASRKLVTSLGFAEEGRLRQARFSAGRYHDQVVVGLLASEWHDQRPAVIKRANGNITLRFGRGDSAGVPWPGP